MSKKTNWRHLARTLGKSVSEELFQLGDVLQKICVDRLYYKWGHTNWGVYVESEVGIPEGTSYRLMRISRWMSRECFSARERRQIVSLGQCKAEVLVKVTNKQNIKEWIEWAKDHTVVQLRSQARDRGRPVYGTKGFWMSQTDMKSVDRAVREAQRMGAETQGDALAIICEAYIKRAKKAAA